MAVLKQMYARDHETQPTASIEDLRRVEIRNDSELDSPRRRISANIDAELYRVIRMEGQRCEICSRQATRQSDSWILPDT